MMKIAYVLLSMAIITEVIGTSALKSSDSFHKLLPSAVVFIGYGLSFYLLSVVLKTLPVGITYAIWAGMGIVLVTLMGVFFYKQPIDIASIIGIACIMIGIIIINMFSSTTPH